MLFYVNWMLTTAQLELLTADVSVVDYGLDKKKKKRKKGEFDNTPASASSIRKANDEWMERHEADGGVVNISDILGGAKQGFGVNPV